MPSVQPRDSLQRCQNTRRTSSGQKWPRRISRTSSYWRLATPSSAGFRTPFRQVLRRVGCDCCLKEIAFTADFHSLPTIWGACVPEGRAAQGVRRGMPRVKPVSNERCRDGSERATSANMERHRSPYVPRVSWIERYRHGLQNLTHNPKVAGSNPVPATDRNPW